MPTNVDIFRNHIKEKELFMEEGANEGDVFFRIEQKMDNGGSVVLEVGFGTD